MRPLNPYFEKTITTARTFLGRWEAANAEMLEMSRHHKCLRILIHHEDTARNLLISCLDPVSIKGPVRWSRCHLRVATAALPGQEEPGFMIADASAGVEIVCGGIEVRENVRL